MGTGYNPVPILFCGGRRSTPPLGLGRISVPKGQYAIGVNLRGRSSRWRATTTQLGGALHSAFSGLSHVDADRPFAGVTFDKRRRPGTRRTLNTLGLKNVSGWFHAHREPQQPRRFGLRRNNSFSRFKEGSILKRLPSARGRGCALPAANVPLGLAPIACCPFGTGARRT